MNCARWLGAALLVVGCGTQTPHESNNPPSDEAVNVQPGKVQPPPAACAALGAPGSVVEQIAINGGAIVATDNVGDVFYSVDAGGFIKLDSAGRQVFAFPFGSVLAVDAAGNVVVAGSFTAPIDLGSGRLVPNGAIDVFVVKLSPRGDVLFATQLGLCGDGVESVAIDSRGRIAVSGTAMGTVVLDANGRVQFTLAFDGHLAFDSHQNLIVAGSFIGSLDLGGGVVLTAAGALDTDGFIAKVDFAGNLVAHVQLGDAAFPVDVFGDSFTAGQVQMITGVAVGSDDSIAILGVFQHEMNLFGTVQRAPSCYESGCFDAVFVAKLSSSCGVSFARQVNLANRNNLHPTGGIAISPSGDLFVSTQSPGDAFSPYSYPMLFEIDGQTGASIDVAFGTQSSPAGYGLGVAVDVCSNVYFADFEHARNTDPLHGILRLIAR